MLLSVAATGSAANCYVLDAGKEALILDAGLPMRKVLPFIKEFRSVVGCLVTHEHGDHAREVLEMIHRGIKVYGSAGTKTALGDNALLSLFSVLQPLKLARIGGFSILPFGTQHDAAEPFGYLVRYEPTGETVLYATDTYYLKYTFPGVHYWIIECNYCEEILDKEVNGGKLDAGLRKRLMESHMSLRRLKDALAVNDLAKTVKIILVHLSDSRSDEMRMVNEIESMTGIETVAASNGMRIPLELIPF